MPNKQYKYWIDGQDLYQMLQSAYSLVLALEE